MKYPDSTGEYVQSKVLGKINVGDIVLKELKEWQAKASEQAARNAMVLEPMDLDDTSFSLG